MASSRSAPVFMCRTQFSVTQQVDNTRLMAEGTLAIAFSGNRLHLTFDGMAQQDKARYMILRDIMLELTPADAGPDSYQIRSKKINASPEDNLPPTIAASITPGVSSPGGYLTIVQPGPHFLSIGNDDMPLYGCRDTQQ